MTTTTPKTFTQMTTSTNLNSWFTVVRRDTGARMAHDGSFIAFETRKAAIAHAKSLGWTEYTWAPDGR